MSDHDMHLAQLDRMTRALYPKTEGEGGLLTTLLTKEKVDEEGESRQGVSLGTKGHPFDMRAVCDFQVSNEHHSTCIHTKVAATVGLGHLTEQQKEKRQMEADPMAFTNPNGTPKPRNTESTQLLSKVDEVLNPLCASTWQETLWDAAEDFWQVGNGYLEVVRKGEGGEITGLHHIPAADVHVFLEDRNYNRHYTVEGIDEQDGTTIRRFACFGDKDDFIKRVQNQSEGRGGGGFIDFQVPAQDDRPQTELISEVIHFRRPTSMSRWYGFPDWVSATASIELVQMMMQHNFDFFLNRGVPEFIALFLGQKLEAKDWEKIENALKANIGLGNSHKSIAANLVVDPEFRVQIEKLAMESNGEDVFGKMRENLALGIVSAHRVPPLLAGIQIPGKLGATNELPNALMAFQILVVGPAQRLFQQTLGMTLGGDDTGLDLSTEDFEFVKITEEINVGKMDTVARMRQTPMQAEEEGRDVSEGVKN